MPDHFEALLKDTPMGRIKLLAAWDSLSSETQIRLLGEMTEKGRTKTSDRPIWLKALSSPSEYVRYLAARGIRYLRDEEIEKKVMADASPLVRYSRATAMTSLWDLSNDDFDRYPKEQKLSIVSNEDPPEAARMARWVEHAVETKSVGDDEIYDVVLEYLCNPDALGRLKNREINYDFFGSKRQKEGFDALWGLLTKVPRSVAYCLVYRLPWRSGNGDEPSREIIAWLETSPYLGSLLWREDVPLLELRRRLFFSTDPKHDDLKPEAVSHHFYFAPEELHELFKQKSGLLDTLAAFCDFPVGGPLAEWTPVTVLALKESAWARGSDPFWVDKDKLEQRFKSSLAELKGSDREKGLRLLRIYSLAEKVVCWGRNLLENKEFEPDLAALPEQLGFLGEKVVGSDTWGTFVGFAKAIDWRSDRLDHLLPHLEDLDIAQESATRSSEPKRARDTPDKQTPIDPTTPPTPTTPANPARERSAVGNTIIVLGIAAALLTILFAVSGILDNEYRNFRSGVIAMAISAGAIVFAGSQLFRGSK